MKLEISEDMEGGLLGLLSEIGDCEVRMGMDGDVPYGLPIQWAASTQ